MTNNDTLTRFIFEKAPVRGELICLKETFQTILSQHAYPPALRQLLGEALCVAGLLSAIIKFSGRLTVQFQGKGHLKLLLAQCDNQFHLRGLAKWEGDLTYEALMESFNDGILVIMLDTLPNGKRYQGIVSWRGNSLIESVEGYFHHSEQLPTKLWLHVTENEVAGLLLQVVPGADRELTSIENEMRNPQWEHIINLTLDLELADMGTLPPATFLTKIFPDEEIRLFKPQPILFQCTCSRKRGEDAILILGQSEAEAELKNNNMIIVTCDFCNKQYLFDWHDITAIFDGNSNPPTNIQIH